MGRGWCCQTGLNCRPLHYQWSALPLSYGSMLRTRESVQKDPYRAGRSLPQAPRMRKRGRGLAGPQKHRDWSGIAIAGFNGPVAGRFGCRFLPEVLRSGAQSICAWGCFAIFCPGPGRGAQSCRRRGHRSIARPDVPRSHRFAMTDDKDKGKAEGQLAKDARQDRLKLALRGNLKRRKSQARGRSDVAAAPRDDADASLNDVIGTKPGE